MSFKNKGHQSVENQICPSSLAFLKDKINLDRKLFLEKVGGMGSKNNLINLIRAYLREVFCLKGLIEISPILLVFYYIYSTSLIPINLYYRFFSKVIFDHYYVNLLTLLSPFIDFSFC